MNIQQELKGIGLKDSEIRIYLYLLEKGVATTPQIAKGTGIARTNCYSLLTSLEDRNLIQAQAVRKRKAYVARDPASLLSGLEQKMEVAKRIVPELRDFYTTQKNKPKIRFYNGWEEVKELFLLVLSAKKLLALGSSETVSKIDRKFWEHLVGEIKQRKIIFDDILMASAKEKTAREIKALQGALYTVKFLPEKFGDQPMDLFIWDDNIAFMALGEPIFGTLITDPALASVIRLMFSALWEKL